MQDGQQPNEPGWVFKPQGSQHEPQLPQETVQQAATEPVAPADMPAPLQQFPSPSPVMTEPADAGVTWTASEYIADQKPAGWFMTLFFGTAVLAAITYIITSDILPMAVIILLGAMLGIFSARQPKTLHYSLDAAGLHIGEKFYPYDIFKSFSLAQDRAIGYISLMPMKRFMPPLAIHYAPDDEGRIADMLADHLPYEEFRAGVVDSVTKRFRL